MGIANISKETRDLIDAQLLQMAKVNATLGRGTTADEKIEARRLIGICLREIKRLDIGFWEEICPDKNDNL